MNDLSIDAHGSQQTDVVTTEVAIHHANSAAKKEILPTDESRQQQQQQEEQISDNKIPENGDGGAADVLVNLVQDEDKHQDEAVLGWKQCQVYICQELAYLSTLLSSRLAALSSLSLSLPPYTHTHTSLSLCLFSFLLLE